jgi:outer membrane protein assembly factor BamD
MRGLGALTLLTLLLLGGCGGSLKESTRQGTADFPTARTAYDRGDHLEAIADFKAYVEQYPGTDKTDDALYYLGLSYIHEKDYALASAQFDRLLRDFPTSSFQADALVDLARCDDLQSHPAALDQTETERALQRYHQFVDQYPDHPRVAEAKTRIQALRDRLAEKLIRSGRLYAKLRRDRASEFYLRRLLTEYPDSKWAKEATQLLTAIASRQGKKAEPVELPTKDEPVSPYSPPPQRTNEPLRGTRASEAPG